MNTIQVEIVSAERALFSGEATMVVAPGKDGDLGIAPRHTPLLTSLRPGDIEVFKSEGDKEFFYVTGGILEVQPHLITVLADSALHAAELDEEAISEAKNKVFPSKCKNGDFSFLSEFILGPKFFGELQIPFSFFLIKYKS